MNMLMDNFKPKSHYMMNGIIDFHKDHLKKIIRKLKNESSVAIKKIKNQRGILEWHIDENYIHLFKRKRKKKIFKNQRELSICDAKPQSTPLQDVSYNVMLCLNFKENLSEKYYEYFIKSLFCEINANICYVIERDSEGYNHIHASIQGNVDNVKEKSFMVIKNELGRDLPTDADYLRMKSGAYRTLLIEEMRNEIGYLEYMRKHYDGLGSADFFYFRKI